MHVPLDVVTHAPLGLDSTIENMGMPATIPDNWPVVEQTGSGTAIAAGTSHAELSDWKVSAAHTAAPPPVPHAKGHELSHTYPSVACGSRLTPVHY